MRRLISSDKYRGRSFTVLFVLAALMLLACSKSSPPADVEPSVDTQPAEDTQPGVDTTAVETCATKSEACGENATCVDLEPGTFEGSAGYICACNSGWISKSGVCVDIDECLDGMDNCNMRATCTNTEGSFECACAEGYVGDGVNCGLAPMSPENVTLAGRYLMAYRSLRESVIFGANDEALDLDDDGALSLLDIVAARCIAYAHSGGVLFPQLARGCPLANFLRSDRFLAMEAMTETECTQDSDCDGQSPGTARCTNPDATCRCLPIGNSGLSECQPQQP